MRPEHTPIGLALSRSARLVSRAFDDALSSSGGSLPVWLVLLNLKMQAGGNQRRLAEGVGVSEATLTHHLNAMERDGLLMRSRDPANRRNHTIEVTEAGDALFGQLAATALAFDQQLRADIEPADLDTLRALLDQLCRNVDAGANGPPWAGLIEATANRALSDRRPLASPDPGPGS